MKKIILVAICMMLLMAMIVPASAEGALYASISAGSGSACRGDTIEFYISISGSGTCDSFGCFLSYDSSVLEFVGGSAYAGGAVNAMDSDGLFVSYMSPTTPSGTVANFTMRVRDGASLGDAYVSIDGYAQGVSLSGDSTGVTVVCNHSYSDWAQYDDSYHQKTCSACGDTKEEEHNWNEGAVATAPTCKTEGSMTYTCTTCGKTKSETLEVTQDHQYGTSQKLDKNQHKSTCSVCGDVITASHVWDNGTVTKKETCKEAGTLGYTCTVCSDTREETIPVSDTHTFSAWKKVDDNQHTRSCSVCQKQETLSHNWNEGSITKKPNCKEKGSCVYTCTDCGSTKTEELPVSETHTYDHGCDKDCNICSEERTTSHSYDGWTKDSSEHWRECTECGEKTDIASHVPGPEATEETPQLCTVCDYILKPELTHEHTFAKEFTTDKTGHWYACAGCEEKKDYKKHSFTNDCDGLCEVCGYTRKVSHDIGEKWYADAKSHFQKCLKCGKEEAHIRHSASQEATELIPQTCEVCGYELAPALGHHFSDSWECDEQTHFHACACGEKADMAAHSWDEGVKENHGTIYTCSVCQYQIFEPLDMTWLLLTASGVAVASLCGIIVLLIKRKKM